jgi:hypothetical protein
MSNPSSSPSGKPDYAPRPAWVKWLAIALGVLVLVVVVALLVGGEHGPGRHMSGATTPGASRVVAASVGA